MSRKSPALILGAALTLFLSACSSPDSEPSPETSTSSSATSSSSTSNSSTTTSSTTSSEESMTEEPAESAAPEPETQPQAAAAEPELLYCDIGLGAFGHFSDGSWHPTELCNTPELQRSVRAEAVCGGLEGRYKYPEEWAELCNGGLPPSDSDYPDSYGDIDAGYAPESGAVTDAPADSDTGVVEGYEY